MNRLPQFCPQCGGTLRLQPHDGRERPICPACGHIVYLNPAPSVAAVLFQEGRVLLVRRCIEPGYGLWCLPGGFVEMGETAEQAVIREVAEETGLICRPTRLLDAHSLVSGFYGDILVLGYAAESLGGSLVPGGDADDVRYFEMNALPPIAFHIHRLFISGYLGDAHSASEEVTS